MAAAAASDVLASVLALTLATEKERHILGVESGAFAMMAVSAVVLLIAVPVSARLGNAPTHVFRRTSIVYGAGILAILFGAFFIIKQMH